MTLEEVLAGAPLAGVAAPARVNVAGLAYDSRAVEKDWKHYRKS